MSIIEHKVNMHILKMSACVFWGLGSQSKKCRALWFIGWKGQQSVSTHSIHLFHLRDIDWKSLICEGSFRSRCLGYLSEQDRHKPCLHWGTHIPKDVCAPWQEKPFPDPRTDKAPRCFLTFLQYLQDFNEIIIILVDISSFESKGLIFFVHQHFSSGSTTPKVIVA